MPDFLFKAAEYLESFGFTQVGLFRVAGDRKRMTTLKNQFTPDSEISFDGEKQDTVCGLFKLFLSELPDPLCTYYLGMK